MHCGLNVFWKLLEVISADLLDTLLMSLLVFAYKCKLIILILNI